MSFKLWSELNAEVKTFLKPDLGLRSWDSLSKDERKLIWKYLQYHFFDEAPRGEWHHPYSNDDGLYFEFFGDNREEKRKRINFFDSMDELFIQSKKLRKKLFK